VAETWIPVSRNRDLDWISVARRSDVSHHDAPLGGDLEVDYRVIYFDTVPDQELWLYERIVCQISLRPTYVLADPSQRLTPSVVGRLRMFLDDDRTADTAAMYDEDRFLAGKDLPSSFELFDTAHPIQVPGGSRLGVMWTNITFPSDGWARVTAQASVLALRHSGALS